MYLPEGHFAESKMNITHIYERKRNDMKTFRQFNDELNGKLKPINSKPKLLQWLLKLKFKTVNVIHRNDINEDANAALRQVATHIRNGKGKLTIVLIEE